MRDPKRIEAVLALVRDIWTRNPDLRLGQIVGNCAPLNDAYYIEDDALVSRLRDVYGIPDEGK